MKYYGLNASCNYKPQSQSLIVIMQIDLAMLLTLRMVIRVSDIMLSFKVDTLENLISVFRESNFLQLVIIV